MARSTLECAYAVGIDYFDAALWYGLRSVEQSRSLVTTHLVALGAGIAVPPCVDA